MNRIPHRPEIRPAFRFRLRWIAMLALLLCGFTGRANERTEILWDIYGVPHIYAKNARELFYAFGRAQMTNHGDLILKLYAQARGRASEFGGKAYIDSDRIVHLFDLPQRSAEFYLDQPEDYRICLDAFAEGINDYLLEHPGSIVEAYRNIAPVSAIDVIGHVLRVTFLEFLAGEEISKANRMAAAGSNAVAIAPMKSASGNAMLLINPHLPWQDHFMWFESHLNFPGYSVYGISLVGMPSIVMGFNRVLGWAHTINPIDAADRYELRLAGDHSYLFDGDTLPFERRSVTIKVLMEDGTVGQKDLELLRSIHGPVVGNTPDRAYAVRIAGIDNTGLMNQYFDMGRAGSLEEFESALKRMQIPMFNIIYADRNGNIFYLFNGNIPVRNTGDYTFWRGTVDGSNSEFLWTRTHPYADLPKLKNPATGFIQNCNDAPWSCTFPFLLSPADYPPYFSSSSFSLRAQRATNLVKDDPAISFDQLVEVKHNTEMEAAHRFLDDLLLAVEEYPEPLANEAARVLQEWDLKTEVSSSGAVLFARWWEKIDHRMYGYAWDQEAPLETPDGIQLRRKAVELLTEAAGEVLAKYGTLDIPWGKVHRFRMNGIDLPANGGPGDQFGLFRTIYFREGSDQIKTAVAGETFTAIVEFGPETRAMVALSYGNATQPGNKHAGDQLVLMSEKRLRPALLERKEVMLHLEKQESLQLSEKSY